MVLSSDRCSVLVEVLCWLCSCIPTMEPCRKTSTPEAQTLKRITDFVTGKLQGNPAGLCLTATALCTWARDLEIFVCKDSADFALERYNLTCKQVAAPEAIICCLAFLYRAFNLQHLYQTGDTPELYLQINHCIVQSKVESEFAAYRHDASPSVMASMTERNIRDAWVTDTYYNILRSSSLLRLSCDNKTSTHEVCYTDCYVATCYKCTLETLPLWILDNKNLMKDVTQLWEKTFRVQRLNEAAAEWKHIVHVKDLVFFPELPTTVQHQAAYLLLRFRRYHAFKFEQLLRSRWQSTCANLKENHHYVQIGSTSNWEFEYLLHKQFVQSQSLSLLTEALDA